ncbi:hypothetical protein [Dietzia maris]|uniref:hypothetical protein n=1 Tax=Dietzia maris TaxID=37915 RepID=UPI0037CC40B8
MTALDPVVQHCYDLGMVEQVLLRTCETDDEVAAVKRVLGVDKQESLAAEAYTPERPPVPETRPAFDHVARTREAIARYTAWVDSHADDDDPTPLLERQRVLEIAHSNLTRLEGGS